MGNEMKISVLENAIQQGRIGSRTDSRVLYRAFWQQFGGLYEIQRERDDETWTFRFCFKGSLVGCFKTNEEGYDELIFDRMSKYGEKHKAELESERALADLATTLIQDRPR